MSKARLIAVNVVTRLAWRLWDLAAWLRGLGC